MKRRLGVFPAGARAASAGRVAGAALVSALVFGLGCASPGRPSPPSFQVPRLAQNLTATREGDQVHLRWTTPAHTTDGVELKAPISADICREPVALPARGAAARPTRCTVVGNLAVKPGASEAADLLPAGLATGGNKLLAYQVQLRGSLGKTAGPSAVAYAASGAAPPAVGELRVTDTKDGALLQWPAHPAEGEAVELTRQLVSPAAPARAAGVGQPRGSTPFRPRGGGGASAAPGATRLTAGATDFGGALDRNTELGATYEYTAQRVLTLTLGGHSLELRSPPSAPVSVTLRDIFPPAAPSGLVATAGPGSIDLSWEPGMEARIAGYRVYRAETGGEGNAAGGNSGAAQQWVRLTPDLLTTASYRDLSAAPGHAYRYRVTAVGSTGNESQPSNEVSESAP